VVVEVELEVWKVAEVDGKYKGNESQKRLDKKRTCK
jgi:hypothetical protein